MLILDILCPSVGGPIVSALRESYSLRIVSHRTGKDQKTDRHLGAWLHIPCTHARLVSGEAERPRSK